MMTHPNLHWLQDIEYNIQGANWRHEHLDSIMESLDGYLSDSHHVLSASGILDICFEDMMGQGRYKKIVSLHMLAIKTFDSDTPILSRPDNHDDTDASNAERFPNEYFTLKLNLAHAAMMLHDIEIATQQLEHIRELFSKANLVEQLEACCIFLKYHSYGHEVDLGFDLILKTQRLANQSPIELHLKSEIAIAYYHYSKGNIQAMEKVLRKTIRLIAKIMPDLSKISEITAELNFYLAVMYRELKQYNKAFAKLDIASEQYARLNHHVQNMLVLYETSVLYHSQKQDKKALQWSDLAYQEFEQLHEKQEYHRTMLDHSKGLILLSLKRYDEALTLFQRVLLVWQNQKHTYHTALATNAVGATIIQLERPIEALEYFAKAKELCDPIKDREYVKELLKQIDINIAEAKNRL
jgi:tetratricopeptide (TPR) repeat protein